LGKRGNNEGSIYKRKDGRWVASITVGYNDNGKPKRKNFYGKTRKEVQEKLNEALHLHKRGQLNLNSLKNIKLAE